MTSEPERKEFNPETNEPEFNWTKISNRLQERLFPRKVTGALQMAIVLYIAQHTWGEKPKASWCRLTWAEAQRQWGGSRGAFDNAIDDALERGLLRARSRTKGKTGRGIPRDLSMGNWNAVKDRPDADVIVPSPPVQQRFVFEFVLFPGKKSTVQTIRIGDQDVAIRYCNDLREPAILNGETTADGTLVIYSRQFGEQKAEKLPSPLGKVSPNDLETNNLQNGGSEAPPKRAKQPKFPAPKRSQLPPQQEDSRTVEYRAWLQKLVLQRWKKPLDEQLFFEIMQAVGPETPLSAFEELVTGRLKRDSLRKLSAGILRNLAGEARDAHKLLGEQETQAELVDAPETAHETSEEFHERLRREHPEEYADLVRRGDLERAS